MAERNKRKYALAEFSVEMRLKGWYFGRHFDPPARYRGPYSSVASVTLMIARQLRREVERRDGNLSQAAKIQPADNAVPPF